MKSRTTVIRSGLTLKGWVFDLYPVYGGMRLWLIDTSGKKHRLFDSFAPSFYIGGPPARLHECCAFIAKLKLPLRIEKSEGIEFYSGQTIPVLCVTVFNPLHFVKVVQWVISLENKKGFKGGALTLYNCDLSLPQLYCFSKGLFPLAFCELEAGLDGAIAAIEVKDSIWDTDYTIPPLSILHLRMEGEHIRPDHTGPRALEVEIEGRCRTLEGGDEAAILEQFNHILTQCDPDLILSEWGDPCILPQLMRSAERMGLPLQLNREPYKKVQAKKERSYFSYGAIVHRSEARLLFGRWHIDRYNSFLVGQTDLEGLFEFARLSKIPVQQMARTSTGTAITSMQMDLAFQDGILIPWRKREPERFKSAGQLLLTDKGGLTYTPKLGLYESIGELDFASMYPSLMAKYNISPETINCVCCPENRVPEIGHHLCNKRRGLIPRFLEPFLRKRARYKHLKKTADNPAKRRIYDERQSALKWGLVTTFGYQGYKNARFGKIEAHETITAYAREKLLQAKEIAENEGFEMLHAIVDSLWLKRANASEEDYETLCERISRDCEIPIAFEGIYRWLLFPPSKSNSKIGVPNRYLGLFRSGKTKLRGIEVRRSDTAYFIKKAQQAFIDILSKARDAQEYHARLPDVIARFEDYRDQLRSGQVPFFELAIAKSLSKAPEAYQKASLSAIVAKELSGRGVRLVPGQTISYVITDMKAKLPSDRARAIGFIDGAWGYDIEKYESLLREAMEALLPNH
ncbi:MAG: DNA polymerase domain-containing protein [Nitrospiria bacterium]